MKYAIVKKDISPLIKKGDKLIKHGKYYLLEGWSGKLNDVPTQVTSMVEGKMQTDHYQTPNFYPAEQVENTPQWFEVKKESIAKRLRK